MTMHCGDWAVWQGDLGVHPAMLSEQAVLRGNEHAGGERRGGEGRGGCAAMSSTLPSSLSPSLYHLPPPPHHPPAPERRSSQVSAAAPNGSMTTHGACQLEIIRQSFRRRVLFKCIYNDAMMLISRPEPASTGLSNALALEKIIMPVITKRAAHLCTSPPRVSKIHFISSRN